MKENLNNHALVSALVDGQLSGESFVQTVEWVSHDNEARLTWQTYHLVGEVLRSSEVVCGHRDTAFLARMKLSLQQEMPLAPILRTTALAAQHESLTRLKGPPDTPPVSANDSQFRWKLLAGFASLATISLIGFLVSGGGVAQRASPQLAQVPVATPMFAGAQEMVRDPQLDALLAAHRQFGGRSALQTPAGFFRNATFEGDVR